MAKFKSKFTLTYLFKFVFTAIVPLVVWMLFIYTLSNRPKVAFTENYPVSFTIFKSLHLIEYAILFLLFVRALYLMGLKKPFLIALILTFAYGLSDEWHQSFIVAREGNLLAATVDGLERVISWIIISKNELLKKIVWL